MGRSGEGEKSGVEYRAFQGDFFSLLFQNNIFYLLSALLMLGGCYLISFPYLFTYRQVDGLLILLGIVNVYEILVILACCFLMNHRSTEGEAKVLLFVEVLFLMDGTFTINAILPLSVFWGVVFLLASLFLAMVKLLILEWRTGLALFKEIRPFLYGSLFYLYTFQMALYWGSYQTGETYQRISFLLWLLLGALPLLFLLPSKFEFKKDPYLKGFVGALFFVNFFQLAGQSWVYHAPFDLGYLLPLLVSLVVLFWKEPLSIIKGTTIALVICSLKTDLVMKAEFLNQSLVLSSWGVGCLYLGGILLLLWYFKKYADYLTLAGIALVLPFLGTSWETLGTFVVNPPFWKIALVALLGILLLWKNRKFGLVLFFSSLLLFLIFQRVQGGGRAARLLTTWELIHGWFVLSCLLSFCYKDDYLKNEFRPTLMGILFCSGLYKAIVGPHVLFYLVSTSLPFVAAVFLSGPISLYFLGGYWALVGLSHIPYDSLWEYLSCYEFSPKSYLPQTAPQWGVLIIFLAFLSLGWAFRSSKRKIRREEGGGLESEPVREKPEVEEGEEKDEPGGEEEKS